MHVEKFKAVSVGGVLAHIMRKPTTEGLPRNFSNENVDHTKGHLNYRLDGNESPFKKYKEILARDNVKIQKRKDLNTFCSVCVTLPEDVRPEDERKFFQNVYEFLQKRYAPYGNVVIAEVHKDEVASEEHPGRPHLHFVFVPLALDKKHKEKTNEERHKVCVKEVVTMADLTTLHKDCADYIQGVLGYRVGILNEEEPQENKDNDAIAILKKTLHSSLVKNLPAAEYKKTKDLLNYVIELLETQQKELAQGKEDLANIIKEYNELVDEYNGLDDDIMKLIKKKQELRAEIFRLEGEDFGIAHVKDNSYIEL